MKQKRKIRVKRAHTHTDTDTQKRPKSTQLLHSLGEYTFGCSLLSQTDEAKSLTWLSFPPSLLLGSRPATPLLLLHHLLLLSLSFLVPLSHCATWTSRRLRPHLSPHHGKTAAASPNVSDCIRVFLGFPVVEGMRSVFPPWRRPQALAVCFLASLYHPLTGADSKDSLSPLMRNTKRK